MVVADSPSGASHFAVALVEALRHLQTGVAQAEGHRQSWPTLLARVEEQQPDKAPGEYRGHLDPGPVCPIDGPLRAHVLVLADYQKLPTLSGEEARTVAPAMRESCAVSEVKLQLHRDLDSAELASFADTVLRSAAESDGATVVYMSGHGAEMNGKDLVFSVDVDTSEPKTILANSVDVGDLVARLGNHCINRCMVLVDVSRTAW